MRSLIALVAALQMAPSAPVVSFDPAADFHQLRSYNWVFVSTPSGMDQNLYWQIRHAVDQSLRAHGFVQSSHGDFAVAFTLGPRENVHPSDFGHYAPYYSGEEAAAHKHWVHQELADLSTHEYTLAIDFYDSYGKHSMWHGLATHPIAPGTRTAIIEHDVNDVVSLFPPKNVCAKNPNGARECAVIGVSSPKD
ncbi:MAG TPA: DUF4136 domain-containing protein [Candidatus Acidoferrum sp.]|jgi:hypothetical protein|nr:DUF4136 domain-containing protein [Candidatus Acidoferrum sp.]